MIAVAHSDPEWLQRLLEDAVAKKWCISINCFPCASRDLRMALGLMDQRGMMLPLSECDASIIVAGLRELRPSQMKKYQIEQAVRWVLYELWRAFDVRFDAQLGGTLAGEVLAGMQAHYRVRQAAQRVHTARQGVKQRTWRE